MTAANAMLCAIYSLIKGGSMRNYFMTLAVLVAAHFAADSAMADMETVVTGKKGKAVDCLKHPDQCGGQVPIAVGGENGSTSTGGVRGGGTPKYGGDLPCSKLDDAVAVAEKALEPLEKIENDAIADRNAARARQDSAQRAYDATKSPQSKPPSKSSPKAPPQKGADSDNDDLAPLIPARNQKEYEALKSAKSASEAAYNRSLTANSNATKARQNLRNAQAQQAKYKDTCTH
jgi:hypothetical protein